MSLDTPTAERPRERLLRHGPRALTDADLLAIVLGTGTRGQGAAAAAQVLLGRFGELARLSSAGVAELSSVPGVGLVKACRLKAALALAGRLGARPFARGERVAGARDVYERVGRRIATLEREVFLAVGLDAKNRVLFEHQFAEGGACFVKFVPRDVFATLVREAAAGVVFVHNHPSGDPTPSRADLDVATQLGEAGSLLGIRVLDHLIVAPGCYYAASERIVRQVPSD